MISALPTLECPGVIHTCPRLSSDHLPWKSAPPSLPLPQWLLFLSCQHCSRIINILTLWEGLWWLSGKWIGSAFLNSLTTEGWQRDYTKSGPDRQQKASRVAKEMVSLFLFAMGSGWVEEVWSWVKQVRISKMWNSSSYGFLHWVAPWSL